jgi:hypothetical protein
VHRSCKFKLLSVGVLVLVVMLPSFGGAAAPIFEMGVSARAMGLGSAFVAIADDESAVFYNPAGLAFLKETTVAAFYQRAFEVVHHAALTGTMRGWGAQVIQIDTGLVESANEFGNPSGNEMHYASYAGLVGFALGIEHFSVGVRGKVYGDDTETGWGVDMGTLVRWGGMRVGLMGENLLGSFAMALRVGAAFGFQFSPRLSLITAIEVWNLSSRPELHIGIEVSVNGLQIRAGYDGVAVVSGAGVRWGGIRLDWAYRMHPQLPASTVVTVAYLF